jgi:serine/threonine protein phosphatase PrpC
VTAEPAVPAVGGATPGRTCTACGAPLADGDAFCESCGAPTGDAPGAVAPVPSPPAGPAVASEPVGGDADGPEDVDELSARTTLIAHPDDEPTVSTPTPARAASEATACSCGGRFEDGWCDTCGAPRPDPRDHVVVTLAPTLGCVSDRGIQHHRNEDAGTVAAIGGPVVACIVADGVSSADGSQAASAAAVDATRDALVTDTSVGAPTVGGDWLAALRRSRNAAAAAASSREVRGAGEEPSCTWVASITDGARVWSAWVGDSRAYLVYDDGHGRQLSTDHSWAAEAMAAGGAHDEVMSDRRAHMITAWLGGDAPELPDATAVDDVEGPGWLIVCSDGLWNYCDPADDLAGLVARLGAATLDATALAEALVGFANAAGGVDNITVAAARLDPTGPSAPTGDTAGANSSSNSSSIPRNPGA